MSQTPAYIRLIKCFPQHQTPRVILKATGRRPPSSGCVDNTPPTYQDAVIGQPAKGNESEHPDGGFRGGGPGTAVTAAVAAAAMAPTEAIGSNVWRMASSAADLPKYQNDWLIPGSAFGTGSRTTGTGSRTAAKKSRNMEDVLRTEDLLQDGKNVLCPICLGIGKIPKEEEKHRVALIAAGGYE